MSTMSLRQRAHQPGSEDLDRLTLAPLASEQALGGALATKPLRDDAKNEEVVNGSG
jgi:hypothetical protein